jgi:chromosome segregation ATPase
MIRTPDRIININHNIQEINEISSNIKTVWIHPLYIDNIRENMIRILYYNQIIGEYYIISNQPIIEFVTPINNQAYINTHERERYEINDELMILNRQLTNALNTLQNKNIDVGLDWNNQNYTEIIEILVKDLVNVLDELQISKYKLMFVENNLDILSNKYLNIKNTLNDTISQKNFIQNILEETINNYSNNIKDDEYSSIIKELNTEYEKSLNIIFKLEDDINRYKNEMFRLNSEKGFINNKLENTLEYLQTIENDRLNLENKLNISSKQIDKLKSELKDVTEEKDEVLETLDEYISNMKKLEDTIIKMNNEIIDLQSMIIKKI